MTTENEVLELDLTPQVFPVRLKLDGEVRLFEVRDITGLQRDRFLTEQNKKLGTQKNKTADFAGYQSSLIALCLWDLRKKVVVESYVEGGETLTREVEQPADDPPQPPTKLEQAVIDKWPARVQADLSKLCEKVSGLGTTPEDETEEQRKNG